MRARKEAVSIRSKILNLSRQLGVDYFFVETSFLIERLVARLIQAPDLKNSIVLKGGYVSLRVYKTFRYTTDLDMVLKSMKGWRDKLPDLIETDLGDFVWFKVTDTVKLSMQMKCGGMRYILRSGIGNLPQNLNQAQILHLDISHDEVVGFRPEIISIPELLGNNSLSCRVYPIEMTVAEKLYAALMRPFDNSRSKDIYDLMVLLPATNLLKLTKALKACFGYRKTPLPRQLHKALLMLDTHILKRGWSSAMASVHKPPTFEQAFQKVVDFLKTNRI